MFCVVWVLVFVVVSVWCLLGCFEFNFLVVVDVIWA